MRQIIRLTESDLHNIVKKSVHRILNELDSVDAGAACGTAERKAKDYDIFDKVHSYFGGKTRKQYQDQADRIKKNSSYMTDRMKKTYGARGYNPDEIGKETEEMFDSTRKLARNGAPIPLPKFGKKTKK